MAIESVAKAIRRNNKFLVTAHINPEGDSLGSQLAMAHLLKALDKEVVVLDSDKVPKHYMFLPEVDIIRNNIKAGETFDAAVVLDCPNLDRTGKVKDIVKNINTIINIDHHVSNTNFGDANWVEGGMSSVGEMVFRLYKKMGCKITKQTALYIYIAILTDTGSFNYSNTSSATHEVVSKLLDYGLTPSDISRDVYESKSLLDIKLLGKILSRIKVLDNGRITYLVSDRKLFKEIGASPSATENFINYARAIKGVKVAIFFREDVNSKNLFHVSLRSKSDVDVNRIAAFFKGGGHRKAAGCVLKGTFSAVRKKVLEKVKQAIRE